MIKKLEHTEKARKRRISESRIDLEFLEKAQNCCLEETMIAVSYTNSILLMPVETFKTSLFSLPEHSQKVFRYLSNYVKVSKDKKRVNIPNINLRMSRIKNGEDIYVYNHRRYIEISKFQNDLDTSLQSYFLK